MRVREKVKKKCSQHTAYSFFLGNRIITKPKGTGSKDISCLSGGCYFNKKAILSGIGVLQVSQKSTSMEHLATHFFASSHQARLE